MSGLASLLRRMGLVVTLLVAAAFVAPGLAEAAWGARGQEACADVQCVIDAEPAEEAACADCLGPCASNGCHAHHFAVLADIARPTAFAYAGAEHLSALALPLRDHRPSGPDRPPRA